MKTKFASEDTNPQFVYTVISDMVSEGASVLDLGCGSGELLYLLSHMKRARGQGIERDDQAIYKCVMKGLSVFHDEIDKGLGEFRNGAFDYVVFNHSLPQVRRPDIVLKDALRVGSKVIVSFPNFGHFTVRSQILFRGRTPVTPALPYEWHDSPNLHFLSILDFERYCEKNGITREKAVYIAGEKIVCVLPNLRAQEGIFLISRKG